MSPTAVIWVEFFNNWIILGLIFVVFAYAWLRGVKVYEEFVQGAKGGFDIAVMIIPYLVAIFCAIGIFRSGGAMEVLTAALRPFTNLIGMDPNLLPLALVRPLSGSGARGVMIEIWKNFDTPAVPGPDTMQGLMATVMQGATDTTFYILAVYCGACGIKRARHVLPACLTADVAGILTAVYVSRLFFGGLFE